MGSRAKGGRGKRERRVRYAALGAFFASLRPPKLTQSALPARIWDKLQVRVSYQALRGLERGETGRIDPALLRTLAAYYGRSYASLVAEVVRHVYGVELAPTQDDQRAELETLQREITEARAAQAAAERHLDRLRSETQRLAAFAIAESPPPLEQRIGAGSKTG